MEKDGWKGLFRPENKNMRSNVMLALFVGILLLVAGKGFSSEELTAEKPESVEKEIVSADRELEERMASFLSAIEGAGQVDVLLTYRQTTEKTIACNETREENGKSLL